MRNVLQALHLLRLSEAAVALGHCPLCRGRRVFVRLRKDEIAARCLGCRASPITMSIVAALHHWVPELQQSHAYELSARGRLVDYLQRHAGKLTGSEFFDGIAPGQWQDGVQCQDVQALTYADASFDVCTSTEVLEHVPNDAQAMRELYRVLKPGGKLLFTVPLSLGELTVERAKRTEHDDIQHFLPPEYHIDPIRAHGKVLAFRNYGHDIVDRLLEAGFAEAVIHHPPELPWQYQRPVVVACKGGEGLVRVDQ